MKRSNPTPSSGPGPQPNMAAGAPQPQTPAATPHGPGPLLIRATEAARMLGVSRNTARALFDSGAIRGVKRGGHRYFNRESVLRYAAGIPETRAADPGLVQRRAITRAWRAGK